MSPRGIATVMLNRPERGNAHDQAIMLPLLEMAGPKHIRFVPDILVIYNYANSLEHNGSHDDAREEIAIARWLRAKTPKERLATL